jgi:hypothetical protein
MAMEISPHTIPQRETAPSRRTGRPKRPNTVHQTHLGIQRIITPARFFGLEL